VNNVEPSLVLPHMMTMTAPRFDDEPGPRAELADSANTVRFVLAGNAHVTFQSRRTGTRYTYQIRAAERRPGDTRSCHFVSVLVGPSNDHNYQYLGCIYDGRAYAHGRKSRISPDATSAVAFAWVWSRLTSGEMHPELAVYHEGRCGKCGRRLTTPRSISIGLGPTCEGRESRDA
jgi:hypothetical protein